MVRKGGIYLKKGKTDALMIPFIGTLVGLVLTIIATFIDYMKYSSFFFSRKFSIFDIIRDSFKDPDSMLGTSEDIILFILIILGIVCVIISLVLILLKKPVAFVFVILALVFWLFGTDGKAWLHYIGLIIALVFSIWYKVASKKKVKTALH